jgi:hypothetical protein
MAHRLRRCYGFPQIFKIRNMVNYKKNLRKSAFENLRYLRANEM